MRIYDDLICEKDECGHKMVDVERPPCGTSEGLGAVCTECGGKMRVDWEAKHGGFQMKTTGFYDQRGRAGRPKKGR